MAVVDDLETGFIDAVHPKARFYKGDLRGKAFIDSVFDKERVDAVIHFAANSQVGESMVKPLKYYDNNIGGHAHHAPVHDRAWDKAYRVLGNGVGFTVKEIVEASEKVVGRPIPAKIAPRRAGDPAQLVASSEKAKKVLGWKPKFHDITI